MKKARALLVVLFLSTLHWQAGAQEIDATQILEKVDQVRSPGAHFVFSVKLLAHTQAQIIENEFDVAVRDSKKSLVRYRQPINQRGRALLLDGTNMWIFIPGTSRPLRISPQQQLLGAVSNADVARVVFSLDYRAQHLEKVDYDGLPCWKLKLLAIQENATYRSIELWVARADNRPMRADFFSLSGKLLRTVVYRAYENVLGKMRPTVLEISNALNPAEHATLTYSKFALKETPLEYYQPAYLSHLN